MVDLQPYKVMWRALIEPGKPLKEKSFDTQSEAENFILSLDFARNREFIRCNFNRQGA